jgi:hypothetical protein
MWHPLIYRGHPFRIDDWVYTGLEVVMTTKKAVIVGAGLAGLCAAITARKMGYEVHCVDKYSRVGGMPGPHPSVDSTPFDCELMSRFLGVPIGEPQVGPCDTFIVHPFGGTCHLKAKYFGLHNVERGHRKTAIDRYLHDIALDMGVTFEWGNPIESQADLAQYPPNTILATGPYPEMFDFCNLPYEAAYGYVTSTIYRRNNQKCFDRHIAAFFDTYTKDYAYIASANGVVFGLLFARRPVGEEQRSAWESQLKEMEDVEFKTWFPERGRFASRYPNSYRLFAGDKILAGGLAGAQDPGTYFGCQGAMVSGKIAAIALEDKALAYEMFKHCNRFFNRMWFNRRVAINYAPEPLRKIAQTMMMKITAENDSLARIGGRLFRRMIPGSLLLKKMA